MPADGKATPPPARYDPPTMRRTLTLGTLLLLVSSLHAAEIPERFAPLVDTVDRCERFIQLTRGTGWKEIYRQGFDTFPADDLEQVAPKAGDNIKAVTHVKGDPSALKLDVTNIGGAGLLKVGPSVRGEFALEMRAMTVSPRLCDLSFFTEGVAQGIGFQFGANDNSRNILWLGSDGTNVQQKDGDKSLLIRPKTWHTIRFEVRRDALTGIVDGRMLATGKPTAKHDFKRELKPLIYVYGSAAQIDWYRVEVPDDNVDPDAQEKAWKDAFVRKTRAEVNADLSKLAAELANPDFETRQAAFDLLARAGPVAKEVLKPLATTGRLESRERAKSLLRALGETFPEDAEPEAPPASEQSQQIRTEVTPAAPAGR